jgi:hypothetical protein
LLSKDDTRARELVEASEHVLASAGAAVALGSSFEARFNRDLAQLAVLLVLAHGDAPSSTKLTAWLRAGVTLTTLEPSDRAFIEEQLSTWSLEDVERPSFVFGHTMPGSDGPWSRLHESLVDAVTRDAEVARAAALLALSLIA